MRSITTTHHPLDNGGPIDTTVGGDAIGSSNYPLRGGKHSTWEGGIRVRAFLSAGSATSLYSSDGPITYTNLMDGADWLPTLLDAAGVALDGQTRAAVDGVSHFGGLLNPLAEPPRQSVYIGHWDNPAGGEGLRWDDMVAQRRWKLLRGNLGFDHGDNTPYFHAADGCVSSNSSKTQPCCCSELDIMIDGPGGVHSAAQAVGSDTRAVASCSTGTLEGVCRSGNDIEDGGHAADSAEACCADCAETTGCVAWTFRSDSGVCYVKSSVGSATSGDGCVSSAEVLLFDVLSDPSETADLSAAYPELVAQLGAMIDGYSATAVPEGPPIDTTCSEVTYDDDPAVGKAWRSWCSL